MIYHANTYQKEAGIAILILDIVDFKERSHTKNERGHVMVIKWAIWQEYSIILKDMYLITKYFKQKLKNLRSGQSDNHSWRF